ncbi:hypothetical protein BXY66_2689 [Shimia isoporae]|uniref:Uncharacterized protein n=1 Tax=Shimia isoporae TaxID=647720 RepID=A0A4R1N8E4_9RHOB|nr:hypothetical protein BXY66_2689 [Shimia isoporae]
MRERRKPAAASPVSQIGALRQTILSQARCVPPPSTCPSVKEFKAGSATEGRDRPQEANVRWTGGIPFVK